MHGAWILAGLYVVIMVEAATLGVLFHSTLVEVVEHSSTDLSKRDSNNVIILTFVIVALIGHVLTLPCLCFAVQTHKAPALVPYLVWRMLLSCIIMVIVVWQANARSTKPMPFASSFYGRQFPVAMAEVVAGAVFFAIAMRAHREFTARRLMRQEAKLPTGKRPSADYDALYNNNLLN